MGGRGLLSKTSRRRRKEAEMKTKVSRIKVDKSGVPILSADKIELKAEEVISYFDKRILDVPQRTPLLEYIETLHNQFKLERRYNQKLGTTKHGNTILGKTRLKPLGLYVDASLVNDPRFNFVLGHELGHVVLHRFVDVKKTGYESLFFSSQSGILTISHAGASVACSRVTGCGCVPSRSLRWPSPSGGRSHRPENAAACQL